MMKQLFFLAFLLPVMAIAQDKGIHFEHGSSWADVQAKAKAENKYIFMSCVTSWSSPCKFMSADIFPQEKVGRFMNDKFISVQVQMDKTGKDNEEVKSWYDVAKKIATDYSIRSHPTYLVFAPDGHIVDRQIGPADVDGFLERCAASLQPFTQYYTQLDLCKKGERDTTFLRLMAYVALELFDPANATELSNEYLRQQKDLYTPGNIEFCYKFIKSTKDVGFDMFVHHADKVNKVMGPGKAEEKLITIVGPEEVWSKLNNRNGKDPDWSSIQNNLTQKYPAIADELFLKGKVAYFTLYVQDDDNAVASIVAYMKKYGHKPDPSTLNTYAWTIFEKCNDQQSIEQALEWSKRSFKDKELPAYLDTYAHLLYKAGKKADALVWQEKAMNKAGDDDKESYKTTLEKMKKGEKYLD